MKVYQRLASLVDAERRCRASAADPARATKVYDGDQDVTQEHWQSMAQRHQDAIDAIVRHALPSGSGWDRGTEMDTDSTPNHLVFYGSFHHMDDGGSYDGWTDHVIHVRPSLVSEIDVKVTGPNRNEIKDYLAETFAWALTRDSDGA